MRWPWRRNPLARDELAAAKRALTSSVSELHATVRRWPEVHAEAERHRRIRERNSFGASVDAEFARRRSA